MFLDGEPEEEMRVRTKMRETLVIDTLKTLADLVTFMADEEKSVIL